MRRRQNGKPIRTAMQAAGLSIPALAARTREVDPTGKGLSKAMVGFAVSAGKSGRDEVSERTATLLAAALEVTQDWLFMEDAPTAATTPATSSRSDSEVSPKHRTESVEPLVDQDTLCSLTKKSRDWYFDQRRAHPPGSATPFPVHMLGRSPRYRLSEVLAWCAEVYTAAAAA